MRLVLHPKVYSDDALGIYFSSIVAQELLAAARSNFCSSTGRQRTHVSDRGKGFNHLRIPRKIRHKFLLILRHQRRRLHSE
jgi:hypothetical protein